MFKHYYQRLIATNAGWAPLALRIPVGIIFMAHGAQHRGRFSKRCARQTSCGSTWFARARD